MRIISRYILREFFRIFALTLVGFVLVFLIVDFLERIDNFLEVQIPLLRVGYFFLMSVPNVVFQMTPVAVLVAVLISLGLLARHSEVVALKASGVSLYRVSLPILLTAVLISVMLFIMADTIIPHSSSQVNEIWEREVERRRATLSNVRRDIWYRSPTAVLNFDSFNEKTRAVEGVTVYRMDGAFHLTERIEAGHGKPVGDQWELRNGLVKTYARDGTLTVRHFDLEYFALPELPKEFAQVQKSSDEMSFADLAGWVRQMQMEGYDPRRYQVDLALKISYPFICLIMALIGLPIAFWKEKGGGIALGIGVGIGLSFVYIVFNGLSRSLGYSGLLPPLAAAWMPNVIFALLGVFLFTHVRQ